MNEKMSNDNRSRNWAAVVYPESAPDNWRDILDEAAIPWCESPLHDKDTDPLTGEVKKAHWHIAFCFCGKKSFEQVKDVLAPLRCPIPKRINDMTGAVRYMAHMDNPKKFQYSPDDIIGHCGFDTQKYLSPSLTQRRVWLDEMVDFCETNDIHEFADLYEYSRHHEHDTWFFALSECYTLVMRTYIQSRRHRSRGGDSD